MPPKIPDIHIAILEYADAAAIEEMLCSSWQHISRLQPNDTLLDLPVDICIISCGSQAPDDLGTAWQLNRMGSPPALIIADRETEQLSRIENVHDILLRDELTPALLIRAVSYAITDRHHLQLSQTSETRYRKIFESIQDVYFEINRRGSILEISPSVEKIAGYTRNDLLGRPSHHFYRKITGDIFEMLYAQQSIFDHELEIRHKDGHTIACAVTAQIINDEGENKISGILRDITERKKSEQEKANYEARLRQIQRMEAMGTLAGGIAHDFNNILTALLGYTELALDEIESPMTATSHLNAVLTAGERARGLVQQILTFSRQVKSEPQPIRAHLIIKEALKLLRSSIPANIEIEQAINPESGTILADPTMLHQIVMNLCTNAYQAMEQTGGLMRVSLKKRFIDESESKLIPEIESGSYLELKVSDSGSGIDQKIIGHIFEPFFTTKRKAGGTGLGLSTVHGIVSSLGGALQVASEAGKGSDFTVLLPLIEESLDIQPPLPEPIPRGQGQHILLVDDELAILSIGKQMLSKLGYSVQTSAQPSEALHHFASAPHSFDLVITDQAMPKMTGHQLADAISKIRPDIPIIMASGFSCNISNEWSENGIDIFIEKPFRKETIGLAVNKLLNGTGPKV